MKKLLLLIIFTSLIFGCKKKDTVICEEQEVPNKSQSKIIGQVWEYQLNGSLTDTIAYYPSVDTYVYIVSNNNVGYDTSTKTDFNGYFKFENLETGNYTVYTYTFDPISIDGLGSVQIDTSIQSKNETIYLDRINILSQP